MYYSQVSLQLFQSPVSVVEGRPGGYDDYMY